MRLLSPLAASVLLAVLVCLFPHTSLAQSATVTGTVVDEAGGSPMPGVNVGLEGTVLGAVTAADGSFTIDDVPPGRYVIVASYSFAATKTATPITDIPRSISVVTKEVIDDQQLYTLNETTRNVSGLNTFSGYNDLVTRGFRNQNTRLINGLKTDFGLWSSPILPHIERASSSRGLLPPCSPRRTRAGRSTWSRRSPSPPRPRP